MVPQFGDWCGPGRTAGQNGVAFAKVNTPELLLKPVAQIFLPDGSSKDSKLDSYCKVHDIAYIEAEGLPNESALKTNADLRFIKSIFSSFDSFTPGEKAYAAAAVTAFMAKLALYDAPSTVLAGLKNDFGKVTDYIAKNSTPTDPFVVLGDEKIVHSMLVDAEGNVVLSRSDDQKTITLSLGAELDKAEFVQQQLNEYGEVYDETRIDANLQSSIFELTHSSDGVEDLQGVVVGKLTQDKLDQFVELGLVALDPDTPADNAAGDSEATGGAASTVLSSLNVTLDHQAVDALDLWFDNADALVLEPYRWESVDATLQAFWQTGSDQVLAAYDLGATLDDAQGQ